MLLNCGVEDSWESLGLQGDQTNQSWIFIGRSDAEAQPQYFGHLTQRTDSLENTLMLGKTEGRRRRGWQRMRWLDGITDYYGHEFEQAPGVGDGQGSLGCCSPWCCKELEMTELLNWTECTLKNTIIYKTYEVLLCKMMEFFLIINHRIFDEKLWQSSTYQQSNCVSDLNQVFVEVHGFH